MRKKGTQVMAWVITATMLCSQGVSAAVLTENMDTAKTAVQNEQEINQVTQQEANQDEANDIKDGGTNADGTEAGGTDAAGGTEAGETDAAGTDADDAQQIQNAPGAANDGNQAAPEDAPAGTEQGELIQSPQTDEGTAAIGEEAPAIGDTVTDQNIIYSITKPATAAAHGTVNIKDGKEASGNIMIPETVTLDGQLYDVKEMESNAFKDNTALTGIDFSNTKISAIKSGCFSGCTSLSSAVPTQAVVYLALYLNAFQNCTALEKIEFNYVQVQQSAFSGSAVKEVVIMNPVNIASNSFTGMADGFTLICPKSLSAGGINVSAFGVTKKPVLVVPSAQIKTAMEAKFGSKVTVKVFSEQEASNVIVKAADGTMTGYEDLQKAFEAINQSASSAPFTLTTVGSSKSLVWPEDIMPAYETTIDFGSNSVSLPSKMVLSAPLTISNVTNFTNSALCNVEAGDNAFTVKNGGSFGFSSISGNNLTFDKVLPGSAPLSGTVCQLIGTGSNPTLTLANIGIKTYVYNLPDMQDFSNLVLKDSYMQTVSDKEYGLKNVIFNNSAMDIQGNTTVETLSGPGEVNLGDKASLTVKNTSGNGINGVDLKGTNMVSAVGGNLSGRVYTSFENSAGILEKDAGNSYTVTLEGDVALKSNIKLANAALVIDGNSKTLSAEAGVSTIDVPNNCDWRNIGFALENTDIHYTPVTGTTAKGKNDPVIELEASVKGKLGRLLDDSDLKFLCFKVDGPDVEIGKIIGTTKTTITRLYLTGYGTEENPVSLKGKVENMGGVFLSDSYITAEGDATYLGAVNAVKKTSKGALVLTDDTTLQAISLSTGSALVIKIPGNKKLTLNSTTALDGNKIPITLTGDVKDGQILIDVDRPRSADMFFLANAPENTVLQYDSENDDYVLHVHKYALASDDTSHWQECTCGEKLGAEAHKGGTATCKDKAVCEVCKKAYGKPDAANHTGGTELRGRVEATTTQKGYTGDTYCLGCGAKLAEGTETAKLPAASVTTGKWIRNNTGWWYQNPDGTWTSNNWQKIDGVWYHFNSRGYMQTGWQKIGSNWYYLDQSGAMQTGWQKINGKWYYLSSSDADGAMKTGWQKINGSWYYLSGSNDDGAMKIGWQKIGSCWYYLSNSYNDGAMKIGWQLIDGYWYYLSNSYSDGAMKIGWQQVDDKWYYLYGDKAPAGHMAANTWIGKYYVDNSGVWTETK